MREIVIEARRVSENQQTVPLSVTTLTGDQLNDDTVTRIDDLEKNVPNLRVESTALGGEASPSFTIRGLSSAILTDPSVVSYFDEVVHRSAQLRLSNVRPCLRAGLEGPARHALRPQQHWRRILFAPQRPDDKWDGFGTFRYGRFNDFDFQGALNIPASDKVMFRISGETDKRDGTIESLSGGPTYNNRDHGALRIQGVFKPSKTSRTTSSAATTGCISRTIRRR